MKMGFYTYEVARMNTKWKLFTHNKDKDNQAHVDDDKGNNND